MLQNLDENTNTELQNTENGSQIISAKSLKNYPVFAIGEIENYCLKSMNIGENPKNSIAILRYHL